MYECMNECHVLQISTNVPLVPVYMARAETKWLGTRALVRGDGLVPIVIVVRSFCQIMLSTNFL